MINNHLQIFNFYFSNEFVSVPTFSHILYTDKDKKHYCSSCNSYKKMALSHSFSKSWHQENKNKPDKIIYSSFFNHNFIIPYMEHYDTSLKITDYYDEFIPELYIQNDCNNKKNKLRNQLYKEHSKNYLKNYKILSFKNQSGFILKNPFINNIDILNSLVFSNFFLLCENCENEYSQGGDNENADFKKETKMNTVIIKKNLNRMLNFFKYNINILIKKNNETIKDKKRALSFFTTNEKTLFLQTILFEYFDKIYSPFVVFSNSSSSPNVLNKNNKSDNLLLDSSFYELKKLSNKFKLNQITNQLIFELNYSFVKKMYSRENPIFYGIDKYPLVFFKFPYGCAIPISDLINHINTQGLNFISYNGNPVEDRHSMNYLKGSIKSLESFKLDLNGFKSNYLTAFDNYNNVNSYKELQISEHFTYFGFSFFNPLIELSNNLKNIFGDKSDFEKCPVFILSIPKYGKVYIFSSEKNINLLNDFIENNIKLGFLKEQIITYFLSLEINAVGSYNKKNIYELIQLNKITSSFQSNYEEHYNKTVNFITKMDLLNDE